MRAAPMLFAAIISQQEFHELLLWGGALIGGIILLFIVQHGFRALFQMRVRSRRYEFGFRPDDLERMNRTGLLSEEERQRVRQAIARGLLEEADAAMPTAKGNRSLEADIPAPGANAPRKTDPHADPAPAPPPDFESPPAGLPRHHLHEVRLPPQHPPRPSGSKAAVDVDDLLARGLITPEEAERLR